MIIHNPILTGSLVFNGTNLTTSNLVTTGSNNFTGSQAISGSLNVTGNITATTLVVQTITSSVSTITGSTNFGSLAANTHTFTGSLLVSGSAVLIGSATSAGSERFGVTKDDGVTNGLHIIADFNKSGNTSAELILGYYADGTSVTGPVVYAANSQPLLFAAGSNERMRITSSGSVGIGTTSPVTTDLTGSLTIVKKYQGDTPTSTTAQSYQTNQSALYLFGRNSGISIISNNNEEGAVVFGNASTNAYASITTATGNSAAGGDMYFKVGSNTERMRISSAASSATLGSGGVLKLLGTGVTGYTELQFYTYNAPTNQPPVSIGIIKTDNGGYENGEFYIATKTNNTNTAPVERVRVTSDGRLLIGQSTPSISTNGWNLQSDGGGSAAFSINNNEAFIFNNRNSGTTYEIDFRTLGTERGKISVTDSGVSYVTTSDYRVKEDFKEINGLEKVSAIKVYDFKFKDMDLRTDGVIAHELQEVLPYAVTGEKDGTKFQGVDYSRIVPVLVKAIQELKAEIEILKTK